MWWLHENITIWEQNCLQKKKWLLRGKLANYLLRWTLTYVSPTSLSRRSNRRKKQSRAPFTQPTSESMECNTCTTNDSDAYGSEVVSIVSTSLGIDLMCSVLLLRIGIRSTEIKELCHDERSLINKSIGLFQHSHPFILGGFAHQHAQHPITVGCFFCALALGQFQKFFSPFLLLSSFSGAYR